MLRGDPIQCHNKKSLCSHPVPCNLHRITMIYLTLTSHNFTTYIPHIRSLSRPISRTLIARHADADMAAEMEGLQGLQGSERKFIFHNVLPSSSPFSLFSRAAPAAQRSPCCCHAAGTPPREVAGASPPSPPAAASSRHDRPC